MNKPPIDWEYVRLRWEGGDSAYRISVDMGNRPTKQGITNRAVKHGWTRQDNALTVAKQLPIVKQAIALTGPTKRTAERVAFLVDLIGRGASKTLAAKAAGINPETLRQWEREDKQLAETLRQARAGKLAEWIARIDEASQRDWKAADRLLQASPEPEDFNAQTGHGGITVVLNIDRAQMDPDGPIISEQ